MKSIISLILTFVFSILINSQVVFSASVDTNIKADSNEVNNIKPSLEDKDLQKDNNDDDIFGDEQTFPFVAGLGKNAAH